MGGWLFILLYIISLGIDICFCGRKVGGYVCERRGYFMIRQHDVQWA